MGNPKRDVVGLAISMPILATLAVAFRLQARLIKRAGKRAGLSIDDFLIVGALIFAIALSAVTLVAVYAGGLGDHLVFLPNGQLAHPKPFIVFAKMIWGVQWLSVGASGVTKLSVLFFYRRIFVTQSFRIICWVMIALCTLWFLGFFFANLLDCVPVELNWLPTPGFARQCVNINQVFWSYSITDIVTDAMILSLPWPQIWGLNMPTARKLQIGAIFLLGSFVVGAGIARMVVSVPIILAGAKKLDHTYTLVPLIYWSIIMVDVGILSACLPTTRPLLRYYHINDGMRSLTSLFRTALQSDTGSSSSLSEGTGTHATRVMSTSQERPDKSASYEVESIHRETREDSAATTLIPRQSHEKFKVPRVPRMSNE